MPVTRTRYFVTEPFMAYPKGRLLRVSGPTTQIAESGARWDPTTQDTGRDHYTQITPAKARKHPEWPQ